MHIIVDGYNLMLAFAHERQNELNAADRDFAKSGVVPFTSTAGAPSKRRMSRGSPAMFSPGITIAGLAAMRRRTDGVDAPA